MRKVWLVAVALVFVAAGIHLYTRRPVAQWTTRSPAALVEFEHALDAEIKFYRSDAVRHLQRALELDPAFVAPKVWLQYFPDLVDEKERTRLFAELEQADTSALLPRERFILSFRIANRERDFERAETILADYLKQHPDDPWALRFVVQKAWGRRDYATAEPLYKQLIERDPNWVLAHNHLGYIYMAQGRFAEAEEAFRTYRFIAPDQANPHDSLGELLLLRGRYEEAAAELGLAIERRVDFCASYEHLVDVYAFWQRPAEARAVLAKAREADACTDELLDGMSCRVDAFSAAVAGNWEQVWSEARLCAARQNDPILVHLAALRTGRLEEARAIEDEVRALAEEYEAKGHHGQPSAIVAHVEGARAFEEKRYADAVARFRDADQALPYWELLKLYNLIRLTEAEQATGDSSGARATFARVREVNPRLAPILMDPEVLLAVGGTPGAGREAPATALAR